MSCRCFLKINIFWRKIKHVWVITLFINCELLMFLCVTRLTGVWLSVNMSCLISSVVRALAQKARGSGFESWLTWLFTTCYTCMEMHYVPCVVAMLRPGFLLCRVPSFLHDGPKAGPAWVGGRWGPRGGWAVGDHQTPHPLNHILLQGPGTQQQGLRSAVWDRHL